MNSKIPSLVIDLASGLAIEILIIVILKFTVKNKFFSKNLRRANLDEDISFFKKDMKKLKPKKKYKLERSSVQDDIDRLTFLKRYGFDWPKEKREQFYVIRHLTKNKLILPKVKFLFGNLKVHDGKIGVKISFLTKFDIACHFSISLLMVVLFPLLFLLSFHVTRYVEIGQPLFWVFSGTAFIIAIHNLNQGFQKPLFLKKMKAQL